MTRAWGAISVLLLAMAMVWTATSEALDWSFRLIAAGVLIGSAIHVVVALLQSNRHAAELARLRNAYDQLDQQAKLIIRTDRELHRTQEELDRKLGSLVALHELSQQIRVTVQPSEVFDKVTPLLIHQFGFSKALLGLSLASHEVQWHVRIGLDESTAHRVATHMTSRGHLEASVNRANAHRIHAAATDPWERQLLELMGSHTVVVSGIRPSAGPAACLLLARTSVGTSGWRGDEELVDLLTAQLRIAIENSALYEEVWHSQQDLERSVQERTRELATANEQLMRLNKAKSEFVSAVSHELRTPLAAIKGYAALLRGGQFGALAPAQADRLGRIEKHTDLLTQLINNLLDIARIESGRITMERRPLKVPELLENVLDIVKPQLDLKRIAFTTHTDGVTEVMGDPAHLPRVFINLLSNAVKYTPEGGAITLSLEREGTRIRAAVRDSGCGISAEELPNLFQEFYRVANPINEQTRGSGLGLVLVKRIVEAHQGQIHVHSEPQRGTTVTVMLPAAPASPASPAA